MLTAPALPVKLGSWVGWAGGETRFWMGPERFCIAFCHTWLSYTIQEAVCASPALFQSLHSIKRKKKKDLRPTQLSALLPISLCIWSIEEQKRLWDLDDTGRPPARTPWWRAMFSIGSGAGAFNLSGTARFRSISDGVKTTDVSSWEMALTGESENRCFRYVTPVWVKLMCGGGRRWRS